MGDDVDRQKNSGWKRWTVTAIAGAVVASSAWANITPAGASGMSGARLAGGGVTAQDATGTITGLVFWDKNMNGLYDTVPDGQIASDSG